MERNKIDYKCFDRDKIKVLIRIDKHRPKEDGRMDEIYNM